MNDMMQTVRPGAFETDLLAHVETCYAVARALTRTPAEACDLTRDTILWAWCLRENGGAALPDIKRRLLAELRRRFLLHYRRPPGMTTAVAAERM